ncbi:hypothetical protein ACU36R_18735 [Pectobacterium brasiliense]|uniref:hypothetical protein n=1 Tax=Pectobacterium brasiliense TaxID=180957 RepID=UPI00406D4DAB
MKAGRSTDRLAYRDLTHAGFIPLGEIPFKLNLEEDLTMAQTNKAGATVTTPELTREIESNFSDIKQSAHKLLLKYQSGNVSRDNLYSQGVELTLKFNSLVDRYSLNFPHADDAAKLLYAVRHLSTC